jgi:hypothetical protein
MLASSSANNIINVTLAPDDYERHEISFVCPPKRIMIDGIERRMRYDTPVPCIEMDHGQLHVIRFEGPPRPIYIDDVGYEVPFEKTKRIKLNGRAHELAWGGPGFEVIIDGRAYELQFRQPAREISIGTRPHMVYIDGDAPDVKILGRIPPELLNNPDGYSESKSQMLGQQDLSATQSQVVDVKPTAAPTDVHELLKKLMEHKLVPTANQASEEEAKAKLAKQQHEEFLLKEKERLEVPDLSSFESELLKKKYDGAIKSLYNGTQCAQCGNRFNQQQTDGQPSTVSAHSRYSKHLDWHFRQNKREKEEVNKAHSRNWFYSLTEWIFYEEISEEVEMQQAGDMQSSVHQQLENGIDIDDLNGPGESSMAGENSSAMNKNAIGSDASCLLGRQLSSYMYNGATRTCPASDDIGDSCCICNDPFEIFWFAEKEEWHFKDAIRVENRLYHPICYEDASDVRIYVYIFIIRDVEEVKDDLSLTSLFKF